MKVDLITIFPAILNGPFSESMLKRAVERGLIEINLIDLRQYTHDRHRQVDDAPYGGGHGMILKPEPLFEAVEDLRNKEGSVSSRVILMTPQGRTFNQKIAAELVAEDHLILICGRYEGIDERVRTALVDDEISIGDYVLTGGELAAAVIVDAVARLIPGFITDEASVEESFSGLLLEYPQYTRPSEYRGLEVPSVLLSGNHKDIELWRKRESIRRTFELRPDLLENVELSPEDQDYLNRLKNKNIDN
ncbi:MAG: tRNA (guanosine(37)-N1)-methyltransferase TrmD [Bacillota bacterium]|nr:tRNA (guanosine(37)-N1)-methyltransferase TrmD [Bacillota bacterium]